MIYITKKGDFIESKYIKNSGGKVWFIFFRSEAKTTPTIKCCRWLNILSPNIQYLIKVFHEQNLIFQYCLHLSFISWQ